MGSIVLPGQPGNPSSMIACNDAAKAAGTLITACPCGTRWQLKAIGPDGTVEYFGRFDGRLPALGAGVILAERVGARVIP
jgi:hypothetical protein